MGRQAGTGKPGTTYHDRRVAERMKDPEFRAAYERARDGIAYLQELQASGRDHSLPSFLATSGRSWTLYVCDHCDKFATTPETCCVASRSKDGRTRYRTLRPVRVVALMDGAFA